VGAKSEIPPDTLLGGKIRLIQRIGRGGMGDVWIARNEATQAEVAVKTLQKSERTTVHDERFRREARLAATISHRNVVRIFDLIDEQDGTLGLVMELLRGGTLEGCMRDRGVLSSVHSVAVAVPILSALHHVHQKGIIHRDVKPANIFFAVEPDGHVIPKILDFGIAKLPAAGSALTMDGSVLGTPHYMSPEQIRGADDMDGRSDMFSLAVVLYEMLTGVRVFQRDSAAAALASVLEHEVDPDPRIEPRLWVALSRALAKRPYERYATCAEFADALRNAMDASDEDLAQSLQELRPTNTALNSPSTSAAAVVSSSADRATPRPANKKKRSVLLPIGAVSLTAVLAIIGTLAMTRSSTKGGDPSSGASSATTTNAKTGATGTVALGGHAPPPVNDRNVVPPPPETTPDDDLTVEQGPNVTGATPKTSHPRTTNVSRPANMSTRPKSGGGDPATKPGF
jgi:eukaryotic-like serine/threonine-protein kinase